MHLDVTNCARSRIPHLLCEIPWHQLGTNCSHPKFFSRLSNEQFPGSCSVHQQSFWLLIFDRIEQVLLPVLCCHLPVFLVVRCAAQLQQRFCLQKNILCKRKACALNIASSPKASWSFPCVVVAFLPSLSQKQWHTAAQCSVLPFSTTWFTNMSWHVKHLLRAEEL